MSNNGVEAVVASYKSRTYEAHQNAFGLKPWQILGLNPEKGQDGIKEPKSNEPKIPALSKLTGVEQRLKSPDMTEFVRHFGLATILILSSDVVFQKDKEVFHRQGTLRDTVNTSEKSYDEEAINFFLNAFTKQDFLSEWLVSFGISYIPKKSTERYRVITEPITISAEVPKLRPKQVTNHLVTESPTGVDLIEHLIRHDIKMKATTAGSDKTFKVTPEFARRIILDKTLANMEMVKRVKKERDGEVLEHFFTEINAGVAFQHTMMDGILKKWAGSYRHAA